MRQEKLLRHEFVEFIPDLEHMEEGTLYVSMQFATVIHKCCCGCGKEVVTPLSPMDWKLIFDGKTISLHPSIGNWSFPCRSHYWVRNNKVQWAEEWSEARIDVGRAHDRLAKDRYFSGNHDAEHVPMPAQKAEFSKPAAKDGFWWKMRKKLRL